MNSIWTALIILVSLTLISHAEAMVNGKEFLLPTKGEDEMIRRATVRLLREDLSGELDEFCTGTAVSPDWIVSAGHCFQDSEIQDQIRLGQVFAEFTSEKFMGHPTLIPIRKAFFKFERTSVDVAIAVLENPQPYMVSIPIGNADCDPDADVLIAGYGLDEFNKSRKLKVGFFRRVMGQSRYETFDGQNVQDFPHFRLYKPINNERACFGDSGAALYCRTRQGHLAISAIQSGIRGNATSKDSERPHDANFCRSINFVYASPISRVLTLINSNPYESIQWADPGQIRRVDGR